MSQLAALPIYRATDANGNPLPGAKLYFYATGTTTPQSVYTTSALSVAHASPVVADAGGLFAPIYLDTADVYRAVLKTSAGATVFDVDPVNTLTSGAIQFLQAGTGAVARTVESKLRERVSVKDFGALGDGLTDDHAAITAARTYAYSNNRQLFFPSGVYLVGSPLDLGYPGIDVEGEGYCVIRYSGDTDGEAVVRFHAPTDTTEMGFRFVNFVIEGNGTANQDGLSIKNFARGHVSDIRPRNITRYGFHIQGTVQTHFDSCRVSEDLPFTYAPTHAWYIDRYSALVISASTNNVFTNCHGKVAIQYGWYLARCDGCLFNNCTGEGLSGFAGSGTIAMNGWGLYIAAGSDRNVFNNFFAEANGLGDLDMFGSYNTFFGGTFGTRASGAPYISKKSIVLESGATFNSFQNCYAFSVEAKAGAADNTFDIDTEAEDVGEAPYTNNGTRTSIYRSGTIAITYGGTTGNGSYTLSASSIGRYVQEGLLVRAQFLVDPTAIGSAATGDATLINTFPTGATPKDKVIGQIGPNNISMPVGHTLFLITRESTQAYLRIKSRATMSGGGTGIPPITALQYIEGSYEYEVA